MRFWTSAVFAQALPTLLHADETFVKIQRVSGNQVSVVSDAANDAREAGEGGVGQNVSEPVIRAIDANTRSVYLPRVRRVLPEMLETFDAPDASLVTGSRDTTLTPLQSLFLMNNRFVQDQAMAISTRVMKQPVNERLEYAYLLTLGRLPSPSERKLVLDYLTDEEKLPLVCQALLSTVEFSSID